MHSACCLLTAAYCPLPAGPSRCPLPTARCTMSAACCLLARPRRRARPTVRTHGTQDPHLAQAGRFRGGVQHTGPAYALHTVYTVVLRGIWGLLGQSWEFAAQILPKNTVRIDKKGK